MRGLAWAGLLVAAGPVGGAPALKPRPDPRLVGTWVVERVNYRGQDQTDTHQARRFTFLSDGRFLNPPRADRPEERYAANPASRPAALDLLYDPADPARTSRGVYRVEGDTLTISLRAAGRARPADFRPDPAPRVGDEDGVIVLVLTRLRPGD